MATMPGAVRALPFLLIALALGACGGGDGSALSGATATRPAATATRPAVTATRPERTQPAVTATTPEPEPTAPATTDAAETEDTDTGSAAPPITLTQTTITPTISPTVTLTATETQIQTQTQVPETTAETESVAAASSSNDTPWGWILLGAALVVAAVAVGAYAIRRRRAGVALDRHADDLARRTLTALDDVRVQGSIVTGSVQALAGEARSLEHRAGDDAERRRLANLAAGLEGLAHALETDRSLRLGSPPASEAQLNYSTSLIRRHIDEVDALLRPPPGPHASPVS
jgi:hypothetical protein